MFKPFAPTATDFYKVNHAGMYPKNTEYVFSNFTPRSTHHFHGLFDYDNKIVVFGIQGMCQEVLVELWNESFFLQPKEKVLRRYKRRMDNSLGPNSVPMKYIESLHDLGYLPIELKALPEGSRVDVRVPLYTIQSTMPGFGWVVNYLETQTSAESWQSITSATTAYEFRRLIERYTDLTDAVIEFVNWQGHDFAFRGMPGIQAAAKSGAGHLLSFTGTDTISAIDYLEDYYLADSDKEMVGGSVTATEHAVTSANILLDFDSPEFAAMKVDFYNHLPSAGSVDDRLISEFGFIKELITVKYPSGIISIVSDTFDFWSTITIIAKALKPEIMARDGKVVFRPDSGDPVKIVVGDDCAPIGSPEYRGAVVCLDAIFGSTTTSKGFKTLDSHVGLIYGDSINLERGETIFKGLMAKGFSSGNIVFGIGSFTYQFVTRDTLGTAIKATAIIVGGKLRELYKDPKTDNGMKKSACGLLRVEYENGHFVLYDRQTPKQEKQGMYQTVFKNGDMVRMQSLTEIRGRLHPVVNTSEKEK